MVNTKKGMRMRGGRNIQRGGFEIPDFTGYIGNVGSTATEMWESTKKSARDAAGYSAQTSTDYTAPVTLASEPVALASEPVALAPEPVALAPEPVDYTAPVASEPVASEPVAQDPHTGGRKSRKSRKGRKSRKSRKSRKHATKGKKRKSKGRGKRSRRGRR